MLGFPNVVRDIEEGVHDALVGHVIGEGSHRQVRQLELMPDKVLKLEKRRDLCANVTEFDIWSMWGRKDEGKKWLAEIFIMSNNGRAIVQEKLSIFTDLNDPRLPRKIPAFMCDTKIQNWGIAADGTVKCCDYGNARILKGNPWKLVKAKWWKHNLVRDAPDGG